MLAILGETTENISLSLSLYIYIYIHTYMYTHMCDVCVCVYIYIYIYIALPSGPRLPTDYYCYWYVLLSLTRYYYFDLYYYLYD